MRGATKTPSTGFSPPRCPQVKSGGSSGASPTMPFPGGRQSFPRRIARARAPFICCRQAAGRLAPARASCMVGWDGSPPRYVERGNHAEVAGCAGSAADDGRLHRVQHDPLPGRLADGRPGQSLAAAGVARVRRSAGLGFPGSSGKRFADRFPLTSLRGASRRAGPLRSDSTDFGCDRRGQSHFRRTKIGTVPPAQNAGRLQRVGVLPGEGDLARASCASRHPDSRAIGATRGSGRGSPFGLAGSNGRCSAGADRSTAETGSGGTRADHRVRNDGR